MMHGLRLYAVSTDSPGDYSDDSQGVRFGVVFENLVSDALQSAVDLFGVQYAFVDCGQWDPSIP